MRSVEILVTLLVSFSIVMGSVSLSLSAEKVEPGEY